MTNQGFDYLQELTIPGSAWRSPDGALLDVLERSDNWVGDALLHPNRQSDGSPVIALRYLVLMKIEASRGQDFGDITRLLGRADDRNLAQVRRTITQYLPDAVEDLERLMTIGQIESGGNREGEDL